MGIEVLFEPHRIGKLVIRNRFVRASTSETMCHPDGSVSEDYIGLYRTLARGGAGLILTGHIFVHPRGRYQARQAGIHDDAMIPGFRRLTKEVHEDGGVIFAELGHAGSQCRVESILPLAPSPIKNFISNRMPQEATEADIQQAIKCFGRGALRAKEAGFDGVHVHAGHGYLISEFSSPFSNERTDYWGGDANRRSRFVLAVYREIRAAVGPDFPVTIKLGMADSMPGGLEIPESVERALALAEAGVDAIEVSVGIMHVATNASIGRFVGVTPRRAMEDWLIHRAIYPASREAYFLPGAEALRARMRGTPMMLVGGIRTTQMMEKLVGEGIVDFVSMARPFIREPDFPNQVKAGRRGMVDCVSCNICSAHEGIDPVQCWRTDKFKLFEHLMYRIKTRLVSATVRSNSAEAHKAR